MPPPHLDTLTGLLPLSPSGQKMLEEAMLHKQLASATPVLHKGSQVSGAYVVTSGRLRVFSISPSGCEATLYTLSAGETCVLALNCLFQDLLYPAWVISEEPAGVAVIPGPVYKRLFEREPSIQNLTVHALSTAVFSLMHELEQVHFHTLEHRLADFLLRRASSEGVLRITQQQMASHLGATREAVARILGEFAANGLIQPRRGRTLILNAVGLAKLFSGTGR